MATGSNIRLPEELLAQVQAAALKEGKTADEITAEAVKRELARRLVANLKRGIRPNGRTDEQNLQIVVRAVHESRAR